MILKNDVPNAMSLASPREAVKRLSFACILLLMIRATGEWLARREGIMFSNFNMQKRQKLRNPLDEQLITRKDNCPKYCSIFLPLVTLHTYEGVKIPF